MESKLLEHGLLQSAELRDYSLEDMAVIDEKIAELEYLRTYLCRRVGEALERFRSDKPETEAERESRWMYVLTKTCVLVKFWPKSTKSERPETKPLLKQMAEKGIPIEHLISLYEHLIWEIGDHFESHVRSLESHRKAGDTLKHRKMPELRESVSAVLKHIKSGKSFSRSMELAAGDVRVAPRTMYHRIKSHQQLLELAKVFDIEVENSGG